MMPWLKWFSTIVLENESKEWNNGKRKCETIEVSVNFEEEEEEKEGEGKEEEQEKEEKPGINQYHSAK